MEYLNNLVKHYLGVLGWGVFLDEINVGLVE